MNTPEPQIQQDFNHCESVYWVFTQRCNDICDHCYNNSGPQGEIMSLEDCLAVVANLPKQCDRIILSGGEPLAERKKLYAILEALQTRYDHNTQIMLQTNGDLLTPQRLDEILARGVTRIDIASMDRFHKHQGQRQAELEALFKSRNMSGEEQDPLLRKDNYVKPVASYGFWGANEEMWLGGNWARGRAKRKDIWKRDGDHNFCAILSGARGFLGGTDLPQEISIQLWRINPCCPGTKYPLGDARRDKIATVLARVAESPIFRALNTGNAYAMGESLGVSEAHGRERARALQNVCLWCDEFFEHHLDALGLPQAEPMEV